jgi:Rrf2 family protein
LNFAFILKEGQRKMEITHQADYALRTVKYLAQFAPGQRVPTSKIAADNQIPATFLTKIVYQLSLAGVINTSRGAGGGVWLGRSPQEITLLEVLEAVDGPVTLNKCVGHPQACPFSTTCMLHIFWEEACQGLVARLRTTTFASLLVQADFPAA